MLIGVDMLAVQSGGDREAGRLGRRLVEALLAGDPAHRYVLYTHPGLPTDAVPSSRNALRVALGSGPEGPSKPRAALQRVLDHNPDGLDWLVLLDPFHPGLGGHPPESPLNGLRVASMVVDLPAGPGDDRKLAPLRGHDALLAYAGSAAADCRRRLPDASGRVARIGLAAGASRTVADLVGPLVEAEANGLGSLGVVGPYLLAGSAGGLDRPDLGVVLEAYHRLPLEHRAGLQLVIAGRLDDPWAAVAYLHDQGCSEGLVLAGPVDESTFRALCGRCSAFVCPGTGEGSAAALVEALGRGSAVVSGRPGSRPDLLGGAGLLADPSDASEFAEQIGRILSDVDLARDLRRRALARSSAFSWGSVVESFFEVLGADGPRPPGTRYRFDRAHAARPRLALFAESSAVGQALDGRIARDCLASHDVDLYFDPGDAPVAGQLPVEFGGFDARQFARNDAILGYDAVIHVLADVFSTKAKRGRLKARPGLVVLRDEASFDRIGRLDDPVGGDVEAEVACQRLRELFLSSCRLAVRSPRDLAAIRSAFPEHADRAVSMPSGGLRALADLASAGSRRPRSAPTRPALAARADDDAYLEAR